jgi:hypothetical protein
MKTFPEYSESIIKKIAGASGVSDKAICSTGRKLQDIKMNFGFSSSSKIHQPKIPNQILSINTSFVPNIHSIPIKAKLSKSDFYYAIINK